MHVRKSSAIGGPWRQAESQSTRQEHRVDGTEDNLAGEVLRESFRSGGGGQVESMVGMGLVGGGFGTHGRYFNCISTVFDGVISAYVVFQRHYSQ